MAQFPGAEALVRMPQLHGAKDVFGRCVGRAVRQRVDSLSLSATKRWTRLRIVRKTSTSSTQ